MYITGSKLAYWEHLPAYLRGERVIPVTWEMDVTTVCNHKCPGCSGNIRDCSLLSPVDAERIVRAIKDLGGKGLILTGGGEPTTNKDALIAALGHLPTLLFTNGELFDEDFARQVMGYLSGLRFSLDAYDYDTAEKWRGISPERWDAVLANLKMACGLKKEMGSNIVIGSGYLTDEERIDGIPLFAEVSQSCGVDYAQCRPMLWTIANQETPKWDLSSFDSVYDSAADSFECLTKSEHKYSLMRNNDVSRHYEKCHAGRFASTIGADMKVYFCCHTRYIKDFCLGDLKTQTIEQIFKSGRLEEIRDNMDFSLCPALCRGDAINRGVQSLIDGKPEHLEFL